MAKKSRKRGSRQNVSRRKMQSKSELAKIKENRPLPGISKGFNPDYQYVFQDLKRIGIIAGTMVTILIALAIFLR